MKNGHAFLSNAAVLAAALFGACLPERAEAASSTAIIAVQTSAPRICFNTSGDLATPVSGTVIQLWPCTGAAKQLWYPEVIDIPPYTAAMPAGTSTVRLVNVASNLCLDLQSASTASGVGVRYATCNGSDTQKWIIPGRNGSDARSLVNKFSNLCLIARHQDAAPGHNGDGIAQYACDFSEVPNPLTVWKVSVF